MGSRHRQFPPGRYAGPSRIRAIALIQGGYDPAGGGIGLVCQPPSPLTVALVTGDRCLARQGEDFATGQPHRPGLGQGLAIDGGHPGALAAGKPDIGDRGADRDGPREQAVALEVGNRRDPADRKTGVDLRRRRTGLSGKRVQPARANADRTPELAGGEQLPRRGRDDDSQGIHGVGHLGIVASSQAASGCQTSRSQPAPTVMAM